MTGNTKCCFRISLFFFPSHLETSHKTRPWNDYLSRSPFSQTGAKTVSSGADISPVTGGLEISVIRSLEKTKLGLLM